MPNTLDPSTDAPEETELVRKFYGCSLCKQCGFQVKLLITIKNDTPNLALPETPNSTLPLLNCLITHWPIIGQWPSSLLLFCHSGDSWWRALCCFVNVILCCMMLFPCKYDNLPDMRSWFLYNTACLHDTLRSYWYCWYSDFLLQFKDIQLGDLSSLNCK